VVELVPPARDGAWGLHLLADFVDRAKKEVRAS